MGITVLVLGWAYSVVRKPNSSYWFVKIIEVLFYVGMTLRLVKSCPFYKEDSVEFLVDFS